MFTAFNKTLEFDTFLKNNLQCQNWNFFDYSLAHTDPNGKFVSVKEVLF